MRRLFPRRAAADTGSMIRLLLVLWQFAALPALCPSGAIEHLCPDDAAAASACSHEDGCSSDPCSDTTLSTAKERLRDTHCPAFAAMLPVAGALAGTLDPTGGVLSPPPPARESSRLLPRTLPLLI